MWRQGLWRQNVALERNVASGNAASECSVREECGVGGNAASGHLASECGVRGMWRQGMWHQNVASERNVASGGNVGVRECGVRMWRQTGMWRQEGM